MRIGPLAGISDLNDQLPDDLFAINRGFSARIELLGGILPVILVDDVYEKPGLVREEALKLHFELPLYPYPGRIAGISLSNPSIVKLARRLLNLVNRQYLPRLSSMPTLQGKTLGALSRVGTDFGIIDILPTELKPAQRVPHIDPVPIFGLVYLNEEQRGGTMFFERVGATSSSKARSGYFRDGDHNFRLIGKIEGRYNRLAIYPGFVPHSGEIAGDWIETDDRRTKPRLTQRILFFP